MPDPEVTVTVGDAQLRRVPRFGVFLVLGVVLGVIVALILSYAFDGTDQVAANGVKYSRGQVFGFLAVFCGAAGLILGAVVAIVLDRTVGRRTRAVRMEREVVVETHDEDPDPSIATETDADEAEADGEGAPEPR